ncbi:MAG TPA: hypothetical protein EYQ50_29530 [Verrucomicrobiales bacterium]|nr:hypothetical protein [Verrucomicrobiales bacterium]
MVDPKRRLYRGEDGRNPEGLPADSGTGKKGALFTDFQVTILGVEGLEQVHHKTVLRLLKHGLQ